MKSRLRILGYMIMHTRQLDMVMTKAGAINRYRDKFIKDINGLLDNGRVAQAPGPDPRHTGRDPRRCRG